MAHLSARKSFKPILPILIIGLAILIAAWLILTKPQPQPVAMTEKAWLVKVEAAAPQRHSPDLTLYSSVDSLWSTQLTASVEADVSTVQVIEGDRVAKGQLLVSLDKRDVRLTLQQREADLAEAEANITAEKIRHAANQKSLPREQRLLGLTRNEVTRLQNLVAKQVSAQSSLDNARRAMEQQAIALTNREQAIAEYPSRLAQAKARRTRAAALRDQALLDLQRCQIKAPFDGIIVRQLASPGKRARIGSALVELYDTDALVLRAQIPNRHLATIRQAINDDIPLEVAGTIDGQSILAALRTLSGEVSTGSGGVTALFTLKTPINSLQKGRFVRLNLQLPPQTGLIALPHEAIYGANRIYTVDKQSRMRSIRVERIGDLRIDEDQSRVLIRSNQVTKDMPIIVTQLPNAMDGLLIRQAR